MAEDLCLFRAMAPEFYNVSDAQVECWLGLTEPLISKKRFGKLYQQALVLLTAHRMKLSGYGAGGGVDEDGNFTANSIDEGLRVGSYSEGGISISYATSGQGAMVTDGELALTIYGLQYLELRRLVIIPIISAGELI